MASEPEVVVAEGCRRRPRSAAASETTTWPRLRMTACFETDSALRAFCSTRTTVMSLPSVCSRSRAISWAVTIGASPRLGSSSSSSRGREMRARPSTSIWRSPPESVEAWRRAEVAQPWEQLEDLLDGGLAFAPAQAPERGQPQVLLDGQLLDHPAPLGHVGHAHARDGLDVAAEEGGVVEAHRSSPVASPAPKWCAAGSSCRRRWRPGPRSPRPARRRTTPSAGPAPRRTTR